MTENYEIIGLVLFALLSAIPLAPVVTGVRRCLMSKEEGARRRGRKRLLMSLGVAALVYVSVSIDGFVLEPNWPELRVIEIEANVARPLALLHISDPHIERDFPARERWLIDRVHELAPDLILITGDIHQLDNHDAESVGRVLDRIRASLGVYACVGYDSVSVVEGAAPHIDFLENESVTLQWGAKQIGLAGIVPVGQRSSVYESIAGADFRIVINHTPDLAHEAVEKGVDLYLCGHTHGGQVRIPFWGAIITNCATGKKYESGLYTVGTTTLHTSRGLGLEPPPAPQVRFLCRPEITLFKVTPRSD